jgi:2-dehydropantoate 2-reductase
MEICVFGAGSLGSALGGILLTHNDVTLVGRRENMSAVRRGGLKLVGDVSTAVRLEARETVRGMRSPELVIITTKAYDTADAIRVCRPCVDDRTMVLTLQNGLGNLELLRAWKRSRAFGGTTTMGANLVLPGKVVVSGLGTTVIGSDLDPDGARAIASAFASCGLETATSNRIHDAIWLKAIVNASINPIAAALRVPNGRLIESKIISRLMRDVCVECESVARADAIDVRAGASYHRARAICEDTRKNMSSMLQDVLRGRRTEIDQINGAICAVGDRHGIPTPLNDALVAMISSMPFDRGRRKVNI